MFKFYLMIFNRDHKMLPTKAGNTKLIHQRPSVAVSIPMLLAEKEANRNNDILALTPTSASEIVGITAIAQKNSADKQ